MRRGEEGRGLVAGDAGVAGVLRGVWEWVDECAVCGQGHDGGASGAAIQLNWGGSCKERQSDGGEDGGEKHVEGVLVLSGNGKF